MHFTTARQQDRNAPSLVARSYAGKKKKSLSKIIKAMGNGRGIYKNQEIPVLSITSPVCFLGK
jgi:hypothetical protein